MSLKIGFRPIQTLIQQCIKDRWKDIKIHLFLNFKEIRGIQH